MARGLGGTILDFKINAPSLEEELKAGDGDKNAKTAVIAIIVVIALLLVLIATLFVLRKKQE